MAHRSFPNKFDFLDKKVWMGSRADHFSAPPDAFQQLVGDALKDIFHDAASISPTDGPDGAIDAMVVSLVDHDRHNLFRDFSFPFIIECKHQTISSKKIFTNVKKGWAVVEKKMAAKEKEKWPGKYVSWKDTKGYLYCVSHNLTSEEKTGLRGTIQKFFKSTPTLNNISPEQIKVWDWDDIHDLLNTLGTVSDQWLGINCDLLEDFSDYKKRIKKTTNFDSYLHSDNLEYVSPSSDAIFLPETLLSRLNNGENIILSGVGGCGKTRTLFEVSNLASENGWRVFRFGDSGVKGFDWDTTVDHLLYSPGKVLVVIDNFDQLIFDEKRWNDSIKQDAQKRGVNLVFLTTARPTDTEKINELIKNRTFFEVNMEPTPEQNARVIQKIIEPILQEHPFIKKINFGSRPILAILIAKEVRRRLVSGEALDAISSKDLSSWILEGLSGTKKEDYKDGILDFRPASFGKKLKINPLNMVVSAIFSACPLPENHLIKVAQSTLDAMPDAEDCVAVDIVEGLIKHGWLEKIDYFGAPMLTTPHDVVTDEILRKIITDYGDAIGPILFAGAKDGYPLPNFAVSLKRLQIDQSIDQLIYKWILKDAGNILIGLTFVKSYQSKEVLRSLYLRAKSSDVRGLVWNHLVTPRLETDASLRNAEISGLFILGCAKKHEGYPYPKFLDIMIDWLTTTADIKNVEIFPILGSILDGLQQHPNNMNNNEIVKLAIDWMNIHKNIHGNKPEISFIMRSILELPLNDYANELFIGMTVDFLNSHTQYDDYDMFNLELILIIFSNKKFNTNSNQLFAPIENLIKTYWTGLNHSRVLDMLLKIHIGTINNNKINSEKAQNILILFATLHINLSLPIDRNIIPTINVQVEKYNNYFERSNLSVYDLFHHLCEHQKVINNQPFKLKIIELARSWIISRPTINCFEVEQVTKELTRLT